MLNKLLLPIGIIAAVAVVGIGIKIKKDHDDREAIQNEQNNTDENGNIVVRIGSNGREIQRNIERIKYAMAKSEPGTPEYETLSDELQKAYEIMKKYKESKFYIEPKVMATLVVVGAIGFFAICLSQEDPTAIKIAQFISKLFRLG